MSAGKKVDEATQKKIVRYYTEDDLTQRQISRRLGVSVNTVGDVLKSANVTPNNTRRL